MSRAHSNTVPWTCSSCGQMNSGWARECGRCETSRFPDAVFHSRDDVGGRIKLRDWLIVAVLVSGSVMHGVVWDNDIWSVGCLIMAMIVVRTAR